MADDESKKNDPEEENLKANRNETRVNHEGTLDDGEVKKGELPSKVDEPVPHPEESSNSNPKVLSEVCPPPPPLIKDAAANQAAKDQIISILRSSSAHPVNAGNTEGSSGIALDEKKDDRSNNEQELLEVQELLEESLRKYLNRDYPGDIPENKLIRETKISDTKIEKNGTISFSLKFKKQKNMTNEENTHYEATKKEFIDDFLKDTLTNLYNKTNGDRFIATKADQQNAMYIGLGGTIHKDKSLEELKKLAKDENKLVNELNNEKLKKFVIIKSEVGGFENIYYYANNDGIHCGTLKDMNALKQDDTKNSCIPEKTHAPAGNRATLFQQSSRNSSSGNHPPASQEQPLTLPPTRK